MAAINIGDSDENADWYLKLPGYADGSEIKISDEIARGEKAEGEETMGGVTVQLRPYTDEKQFEPNVGGGVERGDLKDSDFVFPKERKFPVVTPGDVQDAVSSWGRYKGPRSFEEFQRNLKALCKRKGESFAAKLPAKWKQEEGAKSGVFQTIRDGFEKVLLGIKDALGVEEDEKADGQGRMGGTAQGPGGTCVCTKCGYRMAHKAGESCDEKACPECGAKMDREVIRGAKYLYTFKDADGEDWLLTFTTNAFQDREREIFTTKSIENYVDRHLGDDVKGEYRFWHLPGAKFGDIKWQAVIGRFLAEAGTFDKTPIGRAFKEFFNQYPEGHPVIAPMGWGCSHGYLYDPSDRTDGVYEWFDKKESTVLPLHVASNPFTSMEVIPMAMTEAQKAALEAIGGKALAQAVEETGQARTKELEEAGVGYKEAGEKAISPEVKAVLDKIEDEGLRKEVGALFDKINVEGPPSAPKPAPRPGPGSTSPKEEKQEEEMEEEEVMAKGKGKKEDTLTRQEVAEAIGGLVEQLRQEQKEAHEQFMSDVKSLLEERLGAIDQTVQRVTQSDEAKIAQKAAEVPAQSLQDIINESLFNQGSKARIDGRSSLARDKPAEPPQDPIPGGGTGVSGLDWMISQQPEQPVA